MKWYWPDIPKQIIDAFNKIDRNKFVPGMAEQDAPVYIGYGQTTSQPYTIAFMLKLLMPLKCKKVLEIGTGIGYSTAITSVLVGKCGKIYSFEIIPQLYLKAKQNLKDKENIVLIQGNGLKGLPEKAPFDRILVNAELSRKPDTLIQQLANNGIIVYPYKNSLVRIHKKDKKLLINQYPGFVFVKAKED